MKTDYSRDRYCWKTQLSPLERICCLVSICQRTDTDGLLQVQEHPAAMKSFQSGVVSLVLCAALLLGASASDSRRHLVQAPAGERTPPPHAIFAHPSMLLPTLSCLFVCMHQPFPIGAVAVHVKM